MNRTVFVEGEPVPQPRQRHRVVRPKGRRSYAANYTPAKHPVQSWKQAIIARWRTGKAVPAIDGPVEVTVIYYLPRPKRLQRLKDPEGPIWHDKRPDVDNLDKAVLDALTQAGAFLDDRQVVLKQSAKAYAPKHERAGATITVRSVEVPIDKLFLEGGTW